MSHRSPWKFLARCSRFAMFAIAGFALMGVPAPVEGMGAQSKPVWKSSHWGGYTIKVELAPTSMPRLPEGSYPTWGQDVQSREPMAIVAVEVKLKNGIRVPIPRSCYCDLLEAKSVRAIGAPGGCKVLISGGETGGAYSAEILIKGKRVVSRTVRDGEFPDEYYEQTTYHFVKGTHSLVTGRAARPSQRFACLCTPVASLLGLDRAFQRKDAGTRSVRNPG